MTSRSGLTFLWHPDGPSLIFWGFLLFSLFLHLLGFYLFQVTYPGSGSVAPPPAQVTALNPADPHHAPMLSWIAAEDPALAARPDTTIPPGLLDVNYRPSYDRPATEPIVPSKSDAMPPLLAGRDAMELVAAATQPAIPPRRNIPAPATNVILSPNLGERSPAAPGTPGFDIAGAELLPTRFLVGVSSDGAVTYIFQRESSGNDGADRAARRHLAALSFDPAPRLPLVWGTAAYYWGAHSSTVKADGP